MDAKTPLTPTSPQPLALSAFVGQGEVAADNVQMTRQPLSIGNKHQPVPHREFYDVVREGIERHHRVASVAHCLQREGATYVGVAEIQSKNETVAPFIAWRQSHNRRHSADIHLGLATRNMNTFVVSQSMRLSRNRPGYLAAVTGAVAKAGPELMPTFNSHVQMLRELRRFTLTDEQVSHHVVEMMRAKALTIQRLPYIIEDWYNPLYTELLAERNAYRLLHTVAHYYHPEETRGPTAAVLDQSPQLYHYWRTQLDVASL